MKHYFSLKKNLSLAFYLIILVSFLLVKALETYLFSLGNKKKLYRSDVYEECCTCTILYFAPPPPKKTAVQKVMGLASEFFFFSDCH